MNNAKSRVTVEKGSRSSWLYGGYELRDALVRLRTPRQRDHRLHCWIIPAAATDDVIAFLELVAGADVSVEQLDR